MLVLTPIILRHGYLILLLILGVFLSTTGAEFQEEAPLKSYYDTVHMVIERANGIAQELKEFYNRNEKTHYSIDIFDPTLTNRLIDKKVIRVYFENPEGERRLGAKV